MRILWFSAVASASDYHHTGVYTDLNIGEASVSMGDVDSTVFADTQLPFLTWEYCTANYTARPAGLGSTAVVGLADVAPMFKNKAGVLCCAADVVVRVNVGYRDWAVASVLLMLLALNAEIVRLMLEGGWFDLPLPEWTLRCKEKLTALRRSMNTRSLRNVPANDTLMLRKILNVTYREKDPANWEAEKTRRTLNTPTHYAWTPMAYMDRMRWKKEVWAYMRSLTTRIVADMAHNLRLEKIEDWWDSRYAWAPSGSSSLHNVIGKMIMQEMDVDPSARPTKKTVAARVPNNFLPRVLASPPSKFPRVSTKTEPGRKSRALYAQDDDSFFVSSYASVAMEKYINIDGIYAQQAPSDVAEWVKDSILRSKIGNVWQSLDYDDFNSDHEVEDLQMLDLAFAMAWLDSSAHPKIRMQKAFTSLWSSRAHGRAWVHFPDDAEPTRIWGGLFSGDRNTARDNSILHAVYSHCCAVFAAEWDSNAKPLSTYFTGDDEDASFSDWIGAMVYQMAHMGANFALQTKKQAFSMGEIHSHEYLQRAITGTANPSRPLAAALAQLMSGNWYNTNYVWLDGIISSVSDNCWELHTRGMPLEICRVLASIILNRSMQVRVVSDDATTTAWKKLEWWKYRSCGTYSPLWDTTTAKAPDVPTGESAIRVPQSAAGVDAWVRKLAKRGDHEFNEDKQLRYAAYCKRMAFSAMFPRERNSAMHRHAAVHWPTRETVWGLDDNAAPPALRPKHCGPSDAWLFTHLLSSQAERYTTSIQQLISRFGVDDEYVRLIGGFGNLLHKLKPEDLAAVEQPQPEIVMPAWLYGLDPAIRSWLSQTCRGPSSPHFLVRPQLQERSIELIVAGNAAGKTSIMLHGQSNGFADWDDIVLASGMAARIRQQSKISGSLPQSVANAIAVELIRQNPTTLMLQTPPSLVLPVLKLAGLSIKSVKTVVPNYQNMLERTHVQRGWNAERNYKKYMRNISAIEAWGSHAASHKIPIRSTMNIIE
jgi:hypothetical protein